MKTLDLRFMLRPDGLYRTCLLCGHEFKITSSARITKADKHGFTQHVEFGAAHPRNLMQMQCRACPPRGGLDHTVETSAGPHDPRASLRAAGLESWRDYGG